ncbi:MAG: hypothetical protein HC824_01115 [Synechococcales cyanobacterium RM1_1_8]|nr:hypothetical protein [Synechococcales cyanobacterium RM1_1_8]
MTSRASLLGPLNIGNVVTTGLSLFKSNFGTYLKLAGLSYLWVLVPVYGWAKFCMYHGLIGRMAFGQLINRPETASQARAAIQDRLWSFLAASILVGLVTSSVYIGFLIVLVIGGVIVGLLVASLGAGGLGTGGAIAAILLGTLALIALVLSLTWITGRLFVTEMPIAVESHRIEPTVALGNSWKLTQAAAFRVMTIVFIAALVTFPLSLLVNLGVQLPAVIFPENPTLANGIMAGSYVLSIFLGIVTVPFWQCIKAVTYYDLRSRREGLDIQLRDSSSPG